MEFNAKEKSFEVSIRLFSDDLETAIQKDTNQLIGKVTKDKKDALIEAYIEKHFALINNQKQKKVSNYVGFQVESDATWIYVEVPFNESLANYSIQNDIFFEAFPDQTNLVNLKHGSLKKSILFKGKQRVQEI